MNYSMSMSILQSDKYLLNENVLMTILIIVNKIFIDLKRHQVLSSKTINKLQGNNNLYIKMLITNPNIYYILLFSVTFINNNSVYMYTFTIKFNRPIIITYIKKNLNNIRTEKN